MITYKCKPESVQQSRENVHFLQYRGNKEWEGRISLKESVTDLSEWPNNVANALADKHSKFLLGGVILMWFIIYKCSTDTQRLSPKWQGFGDLFTLPHLWWLVSSVTVCSHCSGDRKSWKSKIVQQEMNSVTWIVPVLIHEGISLFAGMFNGTQSPFPLISRHPCPTII